MDDPDVILRVYPSPACPTGKSRVAIEASSRCIRPGKGKQPQSYPQEFREIQRPSGSAASASAAIAAITDTENWIPPQLEDLPYIELRFSSPPRAPSVGFVFGSDPFVSDVTLPSILGFNRRHFALTFRNNYPDSLHRLVVVDLATSNGTRVVYDELGDIPRRDFRWTINGFRRADKTNEMLIKAHESLWFQVVTPHHHLASPAYRANVERFLGRLQTRPQAGPFTRTTTQQEPPVPFPILIRMGWITQGGSALVSRHWCVSTGAEYACKQPIAKYFKRDNWIREIDTMRSLTHPHIVQLVYSCKTPMPYLFLEYMPYGTLQKQMDIHPLSRPETTVMTQQMLSVMLYLHVRPNPIIHCDIKPENILVKFRDPKHPERLYVKLADFGLSDLAERKTTGGTKNYSAPETADSRNPWTTAVDIWSLGLVAMQCGYGIPHPVTRDLTDYCLKVSNDAKTWERAGLMIPIQRMLVMEPSQRPTTAECYKLAKETEIIEDSEPKRQHTSSSLTLDALKKLPPDPHDVREKRANVELTVHRCQIPQILPSDELFVFSPAQARHIPVTAPTWPSPVAGDEYCEICEHLGRGRTLVYNPPEAPQSVSEAPAASPAASSSAGPSWSTGAPGPAEQPTQNGRRTEAASTSNGHPKDPHDDQASGRR